jgi:outer membrane protein insertion porin family
MSYPRATFPATTTAAAITTTVAAATAALGLIAAAPARAQEGQTVAEVDVRGVTNTNRDTVLLSAQTKTGLPFSNAVFEADKGRIRDIGLYASVGGRVETAPAGGLRVVFDVVENPVITKIDILGEIKPGVPADDIRAQIRSVPGQVLNTQTLEGDIQRIQRLYTSRNFLAVVDAERTGIDPKTGVLTFQIVPTIVEDIDFQNNRKTRERVFLREMRLKVGEPYNSDTLQKDLSRIFGLNILDDIGPVRPEPGSDLGRVKLVIPVQERRTGTVGVSFGYSTRQRLVGALELSETNFRGRGQGVNFRWEVGGIASRNSFEIGFSDPYLLPNRTGASVSLFDRVVYRFNRSLSSNATEGFDDDQYYERRRGGALTFTRPFAEATRGFLTFRSERINANDLDVNYDLFSDQQINNIRGAIVQNGEVASATLRVSANTRDNDLDPARGFFFSPRSSWAPRLLITRSPV